MKSPSTYSRNLSKPILDALWKGKKIEAIKLLREEEKDLELKEAKSIIDQYIQDNRALHPKFSLCQSENARSIVFIILMALAFVVVIYFL